MAEKCWCGRELVDVPELCGPTHRKRVCPDHGEDFVWRPCVFLDAGQELMGEPFDEDKRVAGCRLGVCDELGLTRKVCASCPVPALVDAVKLADERGTDACRELHDIARIIEPLMPHECRAWQRLQVVASALQATGQMFAHTLAGLPDTR